VVQASLMPASAVDHAWLALSWPVNFRFPDALGIPNDDQVLENYQVVPRSYAGLLDWAFVGKDRRVRDSTRGLLLLYKNPHILPNSPAGVICPVGIRMQGFVERSDLRAL
jgi:hypothetical protein